MKITNARIVLPTRFGEKAKVMVTLGLSEEDQELFSYYHDELTFAAYEFIGLTVEQGKALFRKKDVAYLQS